MFFVQGTNGSSDVVSPDLDWQVRQGDELVTTRAVNISNFEEASEVPDLTASVTQVSSWPTN